VYYVVRENQENAWPKVLPGDIVVIPGEVVAAGWVYKPEYGVSYHVHMLGDLEPMSQYTVWRKNADIAGGEE
jgi:hypothetical protein